MMKSTNAHKVPENVCHYKSVQMLTSYEICTIYWHMQTLRDLWYKTDDKHEI